MVRGRKTGVITSVKRFFGNPHDSKTLEALLAQSERVRILVQGLGRQVQTGALEK